MIKIYRYGVISDTHGALPETVFEIFEGVDRIYHCGDIGSTNVAADLETIAPLRPIAGNMDVAPIAGRHADSLLEELPFGTLVMVHGAEYGHWNDAIIRGLLEHYRSAKPRLIVFGHSHVPCAEEREGILFVNPGSPTRPKIGNPPTVAVVEYDPGTDALNVRHLTVI